LLPLQVLDTLLFTEAAVSTQFLPLQQEIPSVFGDIPNVIIAIRG